MHHKKETESSSLFIKYVVIFGLAGGSMGAIFEWLSSASINRIIGNTFAYTTMSCLIGVYYALGHGGCEGCALEELNPSSPSQTSSNHSQNLIENPNTPSVEPNTREKPDETKPNTLKRKFR